MDADQIAVTLQSACGGSQAVLCRGLRGEWFADVPAEHLLAVVRALLDEHALHHLTAITALDNGRDLMVLYHLWLDGGLTVRVECPRQEARLPTLVELLPAADWYEREVHELLGVEFFGRSALASLLLPDDWDERPPLLSEESAP